MSDQLPVNIRKASDVHADQEISDSDDSSIHASTSVQVSKRTRREPSTSIFLRSLNNSLSLKNYYHDHNNGLFAQFREIINGDISEIDEAIKNNVVVDNFWSSIGYSLLENAAAAGQINIVRLLLKHADKSVIKSFDGDLNPLVLAYLNGHLEIFQLLLEHDFDPDSPGEIPDYGNMTCLAHACVKNNSDMVEFLLKHGADPNLLDDPDQCPSLVQACHPKGLPVMKLLVAYGADVNLSLPGYGTALTCACQIGSLDMARLLLDAGADVNLIDSYGDTPLIAVCRDIDDDDQAGFIQFLLERGADPAIPDSEGDVPLDLVTEGSVMAQMIINSHLEHILK